MNEIMNNILTRRSTRAFESTPLLRDEVEQLIKAGLYAPSGRGCQTWKFTAVLDTLKIQKLADAMGKELGREGYDMYHPQAIIIPSNERESLFGPEDNACALENIFLAAHSFDIGSVWINQLRNICDVPMIREILNDFQIPENHVVYGLAALGYAAPIPKQERVKIGTFHIIE